MKPARTTMHPTTIGAQSGEVSTSSSPSTSGDPLSAEEPSRLPRLPGMLRWDIIWSRVAPRLRLTRTEWLFLGLLVFSYAYFQLTPSTNTLSRYDMVQALVHGTAIIDPYLLTPDPACAMPTSSAARAACVLLRPPAMRSKTAATNIMPAIP